MIEEATAVILHTVARVAQDLNQVQIQAVHLLHYAVRDMIVIAQKIAIVMLQRKVLKQEPPAQVQEEINIHQVK